MDIRIIKDTIPKEGLSDIAKEFYVNMVKGAIDVENEIMETDLCLLKMNSFVIKLKK